MDITTSPDQRSTHRRRLRVCVSGAVQGVGFRPFVYRLATSEGLGGSVRNTGSGVLIEVEGPVEAATRFLSRLQAKAPAVIERLDCEDLPLAGHRTFAIAPSSAAETPAARVLPDLATCADCRDEVFDPANRRHRYPFTTCTQCGPRYSVIEAIPYDRARTVMRQFAMCPACSAEYADPASRRFHAETNACPDCGPQLALRAGDGTVLARRDEALEGAIAAIREGRIVALKGLGGFQLIVDARNDQAVARLRARKNRPAKPFAVMVGTLADAERLAHVSSAERDLLASGSAPIVLLRRRDDGPTRIAPAVAPDNPDLGLMLPCTPLHHLLMDALRVPVVATSGNRSGEPLAASDEDALSRLSGVADLFLTHDRPILRPIDDSLVRVIAGEATTLRCARGLAPLELSDPRQTTPVVALGGHMKSSVAAGRQGRIILGPHIGDLDHSETRAAHARSLEGLRQLYGMGTALSSCDAHPGYHTSRVAEAMGPAPRKAPHHLAHVLSAMIDNGIDGPVLGVAWDGTGYGSDGTIWGGEFLSVDGDVWRREAHLMPFRLPGGDTAIREPRRSAIGALHAALGEHIWQDAALSPLAAFEPAQRDLLRTMLARGVNSPLTSSAGRLFDAVAAILDLRQRSSFEGEAAIAVEFAARRASRPSELPAPHVVSGEDGLLVDWRPMIATVAGRAREDVASDALALAFIDSLAKAIVRVAGIAGIESVVLTGGCFQNAVLTERAIDRLCAAGFRPYRHRRVPPNDGGLAVGQAAFAARAMHEERGRCALPYPAKS